MFKLKRKNYGPCFATTSEGYFNPPLFYFYSQEFSKCSKKIAICLTSGRISTDVKRTFPCANWYALASTWEMGDLCHMVLMVFYMIIFIAGLITRQSLMMMQDLMNALPDEKPITSICVVEDPTNCPPGHSLVRIEVFIFFS